MAELFYDDDADLSVVQGRNVAVLGFGSQGAAQAMTLRDSGVDVRVGLPEESTSRSAAESAGLRVVSPYEACEEANLVAVLAPDAVQRSLYADAIGPNLVEGDGLLFAHGFAVRYGFVQPPGGVDVALVAPKGPGQLVRSEFEEGRGVPVLVAVEKDASGSAWELALSYAKAIGGTRAGAIRTTFAEETETDLFGEQAVLCGGVTALVRAGFDTLTAAGYQPEVAYFECVQELKAIVDLMYRRGIAGQASAVSNTTEYGGYTAGQYLIDDAVKQRMQSLLAGVRDGSWAADFIADYDADSPKLAAYRRCSAALPIEQTGRQLRKLMSWADDDDVDVDGTADR